MSDKAVIIGSGFSSLAAGCYMARNGFDVTILEKNEHVGGRARRLSRDDFNFDMGPSFYWMPDIFERFFADFGKQPSVYYDLQKLDPAYSVYFGRDDKIKIDGNLEAIYQTFEAIEPGSRKQLKKFMDSARSNYETAILDLVYQPGLSLTELITPVTISRLNQFVTSISGTVRNTVKSPKLRKVLEFPVLFLGAKPSKTPAFYNFMNFADFGLGTWHPKGGMYEVVKGIEMLALELGVKIHTGEPVNEIQVKNGQVSGVSTAKGVYECDLVISGADYHHSEQLLPVNSRMYSDNYWKRKTFAPSALLFYIAFDGKLKNINHHTLFFDSDFDKHASDIYDHPAWPENPMFYANFPSVTDSFFAPKGKECGTFLIPIAPGLTDSKELRSKYFHLIIDRLEYITNQNIRDKILFSESFCVSDFVKDYNSYGGNAYGLANTLLQTAFLRPKIMSKKVKNLYFTGQLTVPGPGVPPALISGKIVSDLVLKNHPAKTFA